MSHLASTIFPTRESRLDRIDSVEPHIVTIQNTYHPANNQNESSAVNTSRIQYFAAITINIMAFAHGISVGWISPYLSLLRSENSPIDSIGDLEISYLGALLCVGGFIGTILYGYMSETVGRKFSSIALAFPDIVNGPNYFGKLQLIFNFTGLVPNCNFWHSNSASLYRKIFVRFDSGWSVCTSTIVCRRDI